MKKSLLLIPLFGLTSVMCLGQQQDSTRLLDSVVVTATRNERSLDALPMPITVVNRQTLNSMGSLRLQDALAEQTGLIVVPQINAQGNGLQLQGLNPDYTLILIDGEPLIGRYTGSLELNRIAVGNIRQIEVVKGPSSSLYGSDALAGVVNIITEKPSASEGSVFLRYGTNNTSDLSARAGLVGNKVTAFLFGDRFQTSGYDLSPDKFGKTVSPYTNYTGQARIFWKPTSRTEISLAIRGFDEVQRFGFDVVSSNISTRTFGNGYTRDWNINPVITHRFSPTFRASARFYLTQYQTQTRLNLEQDGTPYYQDDFKQGFMRSEVTGHWAPHAGHFITAGTGFIREAVNTSRYGDEALRRQQTAYFFLQHEWQPVQPLTIISGLRLDHNSVYGGQVSPKLSASYRFNEKLTLRASTGVGFKAPDFRQLYFNFTNSAAGGYSVLGTEVIRQRLTDLEAAGQIENYFFNPELLTSIRAERSLAFNAGADLRISPRISGQLNFFRNTIGNLIETQAVASTTSGQNIYTFRNIRRALTEGLEANSTLQIRPGLTLSGGYQLLFALDRDVLERVRNGEVYYRNPGSLVTQKLRPMAYHGLYNRSRHNGNLKLFYRNHSGLEGSLRVIYRSRFGIGDIRGNIQGETVPASDVNGNSILDTHDRFVPGYFLVNLSAGKTFSDNLRLQMGIENILNHKEPVFIPNLPGRLAWLSATWTFRKISNIRSLTKVNSIQHETR